MTLRCLKTFLSAQKRKKEEKITFLVFNYLILNSQTALKAVRDDKDLPLIYEQTLVVNTSKMILILNNKNRGC